MFEVELKNKMFNHSPDQINHFINFVNVDMFRSAWLVIDSFQSFSRNVEKSGKNAEVRQCGGSETNHNE